MLGPRPSIRKNQLPIDSGRVATGSAPLRADSLVTQTPAHVDRGSGGDHFPVAAGRNEGRLPDGLYAALVEGSDALSI